MFYEYKILCTQQGGKFSYAWTAATVGIKHIDPNIYESISVEQLCDELMDLVRNIRPEIKSVKDRVSLRLASQLLLGIVRIHDKQLELFLVTLPELLQKLTESHVEQSSEESTESSESTLKNRVYVRKDRTKTTKPKKQNFDEALTFIRNLELDMKRHTVSTEVPQEAEITFPKVNISQQTKKDETPKGIQIEFPEVSAITEREIIQQEIVPQEEISRERIPQEGIPQIGIPREGVPQVEVPHVGVPQADILQEEMPLVEIPQIGIPQGEIPQGEISQVGIPQVEIPQVGISQVEIPQVGIPREEIPRDEIVPQQQVIVSEEIERMEIEEMPPPAVIPPLKRRRTISLAARKREIEKRLLMRRIGVNILDNLLEMEMDEFDTEIITMMESFYPEIIPDVIIDDISVIRDRISIGSLRSTGHPSLLQITATDNLPPVAAPSTSLIDQPEQQGQISRHIEDISDIRPFEDLIQQPFIGDLTQPDVPILKHPKEFSQLAKDVVNNIRGCPEGSCLTITEICNRPVNTANIFAAFKGILEIQAESHLIKIVNVSEIGRKLKHIIKMF